MMRNTPGKASLAVAIALCSWGSQAKAGAPPVMPMQGVVRDNAGLPVAEGVFEVTFALYASETGGAPVWSETWPPAGASCLDVPEECLQVHGGAFHVLLGSHVALDPAVLEQAPALWFGMTVESDPELPRRRIGSSAYALHAASASVAGDLACSGCVGEAQLDAQGVAAALPEWDQDTADDLTNGTVFGGQVSGTYDDLVIACTGCIGQAQMDPAFLAQIQEVAGATLDTVSNGTLTNTFDTVVSNGTQSPLTEGLAGVTSQIALPDTGAIVDLSVDVSIAYDDVADLTVILTSPPPESVSVVLAAKNLAGPDIVGNFPLTLSPVESLAAFDDAPMAGAWTLTVHDDVPSFSTPGSLDSWALNVRSLSAAEVASNASLDMRGHPLTGLPEPVSGSDAATKGYVSSLLGGAVFGDGADGDVTITGSTTLTRNMYYRDLTVAAGATLQPAGWMIFVSGTLTNDGTIERNGNSGGSGNTCKGYCYSGGSAGGGGGGDAGGFLPAIAPGGGGGGGGNGRCNSCSSGYPGSPGGAGQAAAAALVPNNGGNGGGGGGGSGTGGGSGGQGGVSTAPKTKKLTQPTLHTLLNMVDYADLSKFTASGAAGGGGGGGGAGSCERGGGGGGGGGSNGGLIVVIARHVAKAGALVARGGNGGAGGGGCECGGVCGYAGGGGGGAGGNGGAVVLAYQALVEPATYDLSGGTGGAGGPNAGTGGNAAGGANGATGVGLGLNLSPLLE